MRCGRVRCLISRQSGPPFTLGLRKKENMAARRLLCDHMHDAILKSCSIWREAVQLSKVLRSGTTSGLTERRAGSLSAVLCTRCPSACPARSVGCFVPAQNNDGGSESKWGQRTLFASLGVLALALCSNGGEDGTNCSACHTDCIAGCPLGLEYCALLPLLALPHLTLGMPFVC